MRLLVLGGTHFLGRHVVTAALDHGHEVATFTRGRTGGFRSMDAGVVCLTWAGGVRRADLLVVPPETDVITGARALRLCTRRGLPRSPQMVLAAARSQPLPQVPEVAATRAV